MTKGHRDDLWIGRCHYDGKLCFTSRKQAKRYMSKKFPHDKMTVYRCPESEYFHFGHTPYPVAQGWSPRGLREDEW